MNSLFFLIHVVNARTYRGVGWIFPNSFFENNQQKKTANRNKTSRTLSFINLAHVLKILTSCHVRSQSHDVVLGHVRTKSPDFKIYSTWVSFHAFWSMLLHCMQNNWRLLIAKSHIQESRSHKVKHAMDHFCDSFQQLQF